MRLLLFATVGVVGFLISGTSLVWAGETTQSLASDRATQVTHSPQASKKFESSKRQVTPIEVSSPICEGHDCTEKKKLMRTAKGKKK